MGVYVRLQHPGVKMKVFLIIVIGLTDLIWLGQTIAAGIVHLNQILSGFELRLALSW